jgi:hypothetical protein
MNRIVQLMAACAAVTLYITAPAWAQAVVDQFRVQVPVSDLVQSLGDFIGPLLVTVALVMVRKLPKQIGDILVGMKVEQVLQRAIDFAINTVVGATKDKPLTLDVGNAVVANALQYVIDHAPGWLINWMGGTDLIREKIIARLNVEAKAALST